MWSRVLQTACVAVKSPISSYFIHLLVSESVSVLPAWMCWPVGVLFVVNVHFRMCECVIFFSPCWCVTFCLQHFCFYSYHQCFQLPFPSPVLQSTNSPFPPPAAVSLSQNHLLFRLLLFSRMAFLSYCSLSFFIIIIIIIVKCIWRKPLCIIL